MKKRIGFISIFCCLLQSCLCGDYSGYNIAPNYDKIDYERSIIVCIPSYNNELCCEECLESVYSQNYSNYRVVYIDDASTDNTYQTVLKYVTKNDQDERTIVIRNLENNGMLYNHYFMAELCEPHDIIVSLDGDDKLFDENALARINKAYMDPEVWVTYGQFQETGPKYFHKPRAMLKHKLHPEIIRKIPFLFMQPRTYYAGLFHHIPKDYLMFGEEFYRVAGDVAIMMFIIDLAREHTYFIPDVIYSYNNESPINDFKINRRTQLLMERYIKEIPPLAPLKKCQW